MCAGTAEELVAIGALAQIFGVYDVYDAAPVDSTGSVTYRCTGVQPADTVVIEISAGSGAGFSPRHMVQGMAQLAYNLYIDAARSVIFGNGTSGTARYGPVVPPEAEPVTVNVFGRLPARQDVSAGSYSDTLTVTLNF